MFKRIRRIIQENRKLHKQNLLQLKELEWVHIYHDSIRGKQWLQNTPLNIGRWAGNYAFFYVLNRILNDFKPINILEFGLGESTKFISVYLENVLPKSKHLIIEQDENWYANFKNIFQLSNRSKVVIHPLIKRNVKSFEINSYENLSASVRQKFDVYIVDGPFGSPHFSRYDIVDLMQNVDKSDEFIIVIDDFQREGEKETVNDLFLLFKQKDISVFSGEYIGNKSVFIIGTKKYKNIQSF